MLFESIQIQLFESFKMGIINKVFLPLFTLLKLQPTTFKKTNLIFAKDGFISKLYNIIIRNLKRFKKKSTIS